MEIRPLLSFDFDINLFEDEIKMKGYSGDVLVSLPDQSKYRISFYDPIRLQQDLADEGYIAEPGLIILPELTLSSMEDAVYKIWLDGYFEKLKGSPI